MLKMTTRGILYMGTACNLRCKHCYYATDEKRSWKPLWWLLCNIILIRICRMDKIDLSGGEPTIYPKIKFLVWFCDIIGFKEIRLVTNGTMTNTAAIIAQNKKIRFSLSVHSQNAEDLKSLTGSNIAYKLIEFIYKNQSRINYVNIVITPFNSDIDIIAGAIWTLINYRRTKSIIPICFKHLDYNFGHQCGEFKREAYRKELNGSCRSLLRGEPDAKIDFRFFPFCFVDEDLRNSGRVRCCSANTNVYDDLDWNPVLGRKTSIVRYLKFIFGNEKMRLKESLAQAAVQSTRECSRTKKCVKCSLNTVCDGVQNGYLKIFGDSELISQGVEVSVKIPE